MNLGTFDNDGNVSPEQSCGMVTITYSCGHDVHYPVRDGIDKKLLERTIQKAKNILCFRCNAKAYEKYGLSK